MMLPASLITSIEGLIHSISPDTITLKIHGLGFGVKVSARTAATCTVGEVTELYTFLLVKEDSLLLYGFSTVAEKEAFLLVQTVSGVGPRMALSIVSIFCPEDLYKNIAQAKVEALQKIPGVGKRLAERLITELKDKIPQQTQSMVKEDKTHDPLEVTDNRFEKTSLALESLGFSRKDVEPIIGELYQSQPELTLSHAVKEILSIIGKDNGRIRSIAR